MNQSTDANKIKLILISEGSIIKGLLKTRKKIRSMMKPFTSATEQITSAAEQKETMLEARFTPIA